MEDKKGLSIKDLKSFLIHWNNRFKYDRKYRKKYNIGFNSPEHRKLNQIDIFLDLYEDHLSEKFVKDYQQKIADIEDYEKTGNFLKEKIEDDSTLDKYLKNIKYE